MLNIKCVLCFKTANVHLTFSMQDATELKFTGFDFCPPQPARHENADIVKCLLRGSVVTYLTLDWSKQQFHHHLFKCPPGAFTVGSEGLEADLSDPTRSCATRRKATDLRKYTIPIINNY